MTLRQIIAFIEEQVRAQGMSKREFLSKTGYSLNAFYSWRTETRNPRMLPVIDMIDTLGFEIQIVPKATSVVKE